ncbi:MAG TPA: COX15/CtaA family protein [Noviherbaspirillum sp.]|nr:COX15/CtaA family protein [Noviherbaspirillum sp.]
MLIQLAIKGLLAALLPIIVVWVSSDANKYRKLIWVTAFLTFDLIMFGAFTRLTDSGLGCPDWPGCYGHANPLQAIDKIREAEALMPNGPVTVIKAWIEMIHRYFAMGVGVLIIAIMAISWRLWLKSKRQSDQFSPWLPTVLFIFVCVQGAFGAWTVTMKLQPVIVTIHLLLGMSLLALLAWAGARQNDHQPVATIAMKLRVPATAALALLFIQIALGGWVSTNYAALACLDFPMCDGALIPQMDFGNGFTLWRDLGKTASGDYLPFPALTAIHWVHRMFAFVVVLFIVWAAHKAMQIEGLQRVGKWLLVAVVVQFFIGVSTIFLRWPLALAVAHNGGATVLVMLLVMLNYRTRIPGQTATDQAITRLSTA